MSIRTRAPLVVLPVLAIALPPAGAQVTPYGSGVNPPGSLVLLEGVPMVGESFTVGVSNTATQAAPAALAFLSVASAPDAAFPAGTVVPGFGLSAPGAPGELLLSLTGGFFRTVGPVSWGGGNAPPAGFPLTLPLVPSLVGLQLFLQGSLLDISAQPFLGVTNGLAVTLAAPDLPGLVLIQPGTFQMGSGASSGAPYFNGAGPQPPHQVTLTKPYWIGRYEVTQAEYEALMGTNPSSYVGANRPVERVGLTGAMGYCAALTAQETAAGKVPPGYQYRLPTEAEWEYACRAGTTTEYNVGLALVCDQARFWYDGVSDSLCGVSTVPSAPNGGHVPVGSYSPNPWGLYDMHGNVWELCLDTWGFYTSSPKTDPFVTGGTDPVIRGGGWLNFQNHCRSANRVPYAVFGDSFSMIGFRVVLAPVLVP